MQETRKDRAWNELVDFMYWFITMNLVSELRLRVSGSGFRESCSSAQGFGFTVWGSRVEVWG